MSDKKKISIITVNYGQSQKIEKLWDSLLKFPPICDWEFIIVDNASARDDGERIKKMFENKKNVHTILLSENIGFGAGNAEGVKFATGEILALLNPDTEVTDGCLDELVRKLETEKDAGIVVPVLQTHDGKTLQNARRFPSMFKLIRRRLFGKKFENSKTIPEAFPIDWAQGSFWVMKKSLFEKLGGFDPRFFLFLEDTDLCRRVWESGNRVLQIPKAIAIHQPNRLSGGNIFLALGRKTFWIHIASAVKYFWKWKGKSTPRVF